MALILAGLLALPACASDAARSAGNVTTETFAQSAVSPETVDALAELSTLAVEPEHLGAPSYNRDDWGDWLDADHDGCDTRDEVLIEEAVVAHVVVGSGCTLAGGQWTSSYDGRTTSDPSSLDVDHVVALAEADRSGGWAWNASTKAAFANDLDDARTLVAVTASVNRAKGDQDPAGWLPERDVCTYVADWIEVKARWRLAVDATEATVLSGLLVGQCAGATVVG